jgi:hypothetical protein
MQRPSFNGEYIRRELDRLSSKVTIPVKLSIIGGMGLIHFGLKAATKDIDVVLQSSSELCALSAALEGLGYSSPSSVRISKPYRDMEASKILENRDGFRWDIFQQKVCGALTFSKGMISRATDFYNKGLLRILLASKEDLFLFKGITDREADLDDMRLLAESGLDWRIIEQECGNQSALSGRLWENALYENLKELREKHKIKSPIEKTLRKTVEERLAEGALVRAVEEGSFTVAMISKTTKLPEYFIRKSAQEMEKKGMLRIDRSKRPHRLALTTTSIL